MNSIRLREIARLILCIAICQLAGVIGLLFTASSVTTWYTTLDKPWFTPPGSIISAVWIILFALMGLSLFLIWQKGISSTNSKIALGVFACQLLVNILWSYAFFGLQSPLAAIIVIVFLWLLILQCIIRFWHISKYAAMLLVPYILWVSFAAFLNYTLWMLNL
ncbi:MAG: tryptophan-rich sensory protein [Methanothrix sp.]|jgi:tryptophan-rich sensory protein|nr:tryptophan-rich sensory protein [Methanothrix sp.]